LSGRLSFADYFEQMASRDELTCLTVDTTGACDLTCAGMCYYHPDIPLRRRETPFESLASAIEEAERLLDLKTLVIAGKEPFLNPRRLFAILDDAGSRSSRGYLVGLITNGRHIHRHWDQLEQAARGGWIDFLDVSIDSGFPEQHDAFRGVPGTYDLASAAVRAAATNLHTVRTSICSILRPDNPAGILELLRRQSDVIQRFWVFPVQPPPFSAMPPLAGKFVSSFLRTLVTLLDGELRDREMQVMVPLQGLYLSEAVDEGLFDWCDLREDEVGACYAAIPAGRSTLLIQCSVLPEQAWKLARITYAGDYLAQLHFLQSPDPSHHAMGNIADEPIRKLYKKSKTQGGVLHRLCLARQTHECRQWTCWGHCFGGWSVAEQSLLDGTSNNKKPRLCTKSSTDLTQIGGVRIP
jgi:MoaA/NifB/PqqE/SkfB family radical SAM enzyme